jgi:uncharacterized membrane protein
MEYLPDFIAFSISFLYGLAASLININRYWQFELGYYDFGIFDTAIWKVSRFLPPIIDHFMVPGKIIFADHFNPSIFLLSPLYWITTRPETILVAQSFLVGMSGYVLFKIGNKILNSKYYSLSVVLTYFLFDGLQNAAYQDFHELTLMVFFLMFTYYAFFFERKKLFIFLFIITLGFKESLFLLGIGLSLFIYYENKKWRNVAFFCFLYSLLYGFITIRVVIPFFSGGIYAYAPKLSTTPFLVLKDLIFPYLKIKTVFLTFLSFVFLPLVSLSTLPMIFLNFFSRFLSEGAIRWDLGMHYNAEITSTLAIGTILGIKKLSNT